MKKLLPERKREKPQIVVTNLIDVILLLVFFFMITSSFAKETRKLPINLPKASSGASIEGESLTFQVDGQGRYLLSGAEVVPGDVPAKVTAFIGENRERAILVEADQTVNYGKVVSLLDLIRAAGGVNLGLSTKPSPETR